ncbi:MAG: NUDIX domain-containing protein [Patescibacteria group bacterium]
MQNLKVAKIENTIETITAGGVVMNDGKVIVVNQNGNSWSLPKGHIEAGENLMDAAKREIYEESGITELEYIKPLGKYARHKIGKDGNTDSSELKHITIFLFKTKETELNPQDKENPEAIWLPISEVSSKLTHQKDKEFFESVISLLK